MQLARDAAPLLVLHLQQAAGKQTQALLRAPGLGHAFTTIEHGLPVLDDAQLREMANLGLSLEER